MDPRQFHGRLFDAVRHLIPPGAGVVCGVSGGPDSMALLHALFAVNAQRKRGWQLYAAHLNHGLRPEAEADARFVAKAAARLGLTCDVQSVDVAASAKGSNQGVEETGRRRRYEYLEEVAIKKAATVVAVGHHADDQAETVLHHVIRGTGLRGLSGMPSCRPIREGSDIQLVRPLLGLRRDELRAYLDGQSIAYREDLSNFDPAVATRNAIRHQVMPLLRELVNPQAATALLRLAAQAERVRKAIAGYAEEALNQLQIRRGEGSVVLAADALARLPMAVQTEIVVVVLRRLGASLQAVDFERIEAAVAQGDVAGRGRRVELPGGVVVERRGRELSIRWLASSSCNPPDHPVAGERS
jgi:tRNA(Ile)-lysidine synthase